MGARTVAAKADEHAAIEALRRAVRVGRCASPTADPDEWFALVKAPAGTSQSERRSLEATQARQQCAGCPVISACLELALRTRDIEHGVWGGHAAWERRELLIAASTPVVAPADNSTGEAA